MKLANLLRLFLLLPTLVACWESHAQPQKLRFENLSTDQGLSSNNVWNIIQDRQGYIWFGTYNGLNRYDGYRFTAYTYRPHDPKSVSQNIIFALFEDSQGHIWLGTTEGGICKFDRKTEQFTTYRPEQPKNLYVPALRAVSAINEDQDGMLWVGNFAGELRRFDKNTGKFSQKYLLGREATGDSLRFDEINTIYKDRSGTLWFGNTTGLHRLNLVRSKPGQASRISFTHFQHDPTNPNTISDNYISSIFEDAKGLLWIGTFQHGLNGFNPKTGQVSRYTHKPADPYSLSSGNIRRQSIAEDSQGNLWIGTNNGLNKLNSQRTQFTCYYHDPTQPFSIGENFIGNLLVDKAGHLWASTGAGISKLDPFQKPFVLYRNDPYEATSLKEGQITAICEDQTGRVWIGTASGGLDVFDQQTGTFTHLQKTMAKLNAANKGVVGTILEDQSGKIWISKGSQLFLYDPKRGLFSPSSGSSKLDKSLQNTINILSLHQDREGLLWIGTMRGVKSYNPKTGAVQHYYHNPNSPNSISDHLIKTILEDRRGNIWLGHGSVALSRLDKRTGKIIRYAHNPLDSTSISSNVVVSLYEDRQGNFWIGTIAGGLCQFNYQTGRFTTYAEPQGLSGNCVFSILDDQQGNLWLGTNNGLFRFHLTNHTFTRYDASDGLQGNDFGGAARRGRDGTLYIGGSQGLNVFRPEQIRTNMVHGPVVFTEFRLFDKRVPGKHEAAVIELPYNQNFFSFEFAALSYSSAHKNQYAYQLEGLESDWVYSRTRRTASYTSVPPGTYTFRVKASNSDGIWNEQGKSIQVIIHPPWWRTIWAYLLYAVVFVASVWTFIVYRSRTLRRENRLLEQKVVLRTEQIQHQKEEIEAQRDNLEQTLTELKSTQQQLIQKEKMASLGELTAGIAHEIQNPLNFVNNLSEVSTELVDELEEEIKAGRTNDALDLTGDLRETLQKVHHHGKRADSIVKGMLQHSRASSGEKQPTDLNKLADEYLRLAYQGLRAKDKSFNADLRLNLDPNLKLVNVAPQEIGRVLLNLYNNAFYATQEKMKQTGKAGVESDYQPQIEITTHGENGRVELRVKDNGIGISPEVIDKIYQPFFTTKPTGQGTGLGLSLSYDIVTKGHGGELSVHTEEGQYTEFVLRIPALRGT